MGLIRTHPGENNYFLGNVGVRTIPSEALTVAGNISVLSGGSISVAVASLQSNYFGTWQGDILSSSQVNVEGVDIKATGISKDLFLKTTGDGRVVWDPTPFAGSSGNVDGSGTTNTLAKFTDSDTIGNSIVTDNGSLVTVGGDLSASGNITVAGGKNIYVNESDNTYIDSDSTDRLRVVAGGHQMMVWDYDTGQRAVFGNGTKVYIGANDNALPEEALTVSGNISSNGTVTADTIVANTLLSATNIDITYELSGFSVTGDISANGTITAEDGEIKDYLKAGRLTVNSAGLGSHDFRVEGTSTQYLIFADASCNNVGIGTAAAKEKLTVSGSISSQGYCSDVDNNTIIGTNALSQNLSGACNVAIGNGASFKSVSAFDTVAIGASALYHSWGGEGIASRQTAVGACALLNNTTGRINTAVGWSAMSKNTTGMYNAAVGAYALCSNTTGVCNTAVGAAAGLLNTTGNFNTAVGYISLWGNITGSDSTHIGYLAGGQYSNGSCNTAVGSNVLKDNTTGYCNTIVGGWGMCGNTIGYRNIAIGEKAGEKYMFLGLFPSALQESTNSIFIGADTYGPDNVNAPNNTIVIGHSARSMGSNTVLLGNPGVTDTYLAGCINVDEYIVHNGDADTYIRLQANNLNMVAGGKSAIKLDTSTGNIQLNNTNEDLDVQLMADDGEVILHTDAGTNKVGINTTAPTEALTLIGNLTATGTLSAAGAIVTQNNVYGVKVCGGTAVCAPAVCGTTSVCSPIVCGTTCVRGAYVCSTGDICAGSGIVYGGGCVCGSNVTDGYSCLDGSGNVCASYCVCAGSDVLADGDICASGGTVCGYYGCFDTLFAGGAQVYASSIPNSCLANSSVSYGGVSVALGASCAAPPFTLGNTTVAGTLTSTGGISTSGGLTATNVLSANNYFGGNVGIGTTGPTERLEVAPDTDASAVIGRAHVGYVGDADYAGFAHIDFADATNYALAQTSAGHTVLNAGDGDNIYFREGDANMEAFDGGTKDFYVDTDTLYVDASEDKVGIGTDAPDEALHVFNGCIDTRGTNVENSTVQLYFDANNGNGSGTSNDLGPGITWEPAYSGYSKRSAGILSIGEGNYFRSGLAFYTNDTADNSTDWSERMRISMEGNVGIGDPEPTEKLTVTGNISAQGILKNSQANYQTLTDAEQITWDACLRPCWGCYIRWK